MEQIRRILNRIVSILTTYTLLEIYHILIYKFIRKTYYIKKNKKNKKWAIILYVDSPFYFHKDTRFMNHQAYREAIKIANILEDIGYNYIVENYESKPKFGSKKFDLIFGHEPNFIYYSEKNPDAIKIIYSAGSYYEQRNEGIKNRIDSFNRKFNAKIKYTRLIEPHNGFEKADMIFQIGNNVTKGTFPPLLQNKIHLINQSSNFIKTIDIENKIKKSCRNVFVWMGSSGSILKGFDLVFDYFSTHKELKLKIIGEIDTEVYNIYKKEIEQSHNITYYGFVNVNTEHFIHIVSDASFIIYPSITEGGCPGAVITLMQNGLIPLVSRICKFDEIDECGFVIPEVSLSGIKYSIDWAKSLTNDDIRHKQKKSYQISTKKWNINSFERDFKNGINIVLNNKEKQYKNKLYL